MKAAAAQRVILICQPALFGTLPPHTCSGAHWVFPFTILQRLTNRSTAVSTSCGRTSGCNGTSVTSSAKPATPPLCQALYIGVFYRFRDAAFVTFRYDYSYFAFSLAYDVNISGFTPASNTVGGFELSIQYKGIFGKNKNAKRSSVRFM